MTSDGIGLSILFQLTVWGLLGSPTVETNGEVLPSAARCRIRLGVLVEKRDGVSLQDAVSFTWNEIRTTSPADEVEILMETTDRYQDMTMDSIIEAFIDMESDNLSAVIGRYIQPVLTAAQKHTIPYFLMGEHWLDQFLPYNLISVRPRTVDLYAVTVDIVRMYNWTTVAVVYERPYGSFLIESLVRSPSVQVRGWIVNRSMTPTQTRDLLLQVRTLDIVNVIVTCSRDTTKTLLNAALELSMLTNRHTWILPTLNETSSLVNEYSYSGANLMTYQLQLTRSPPKDFPVVQFPVSEYATIYDSLLALYNGVRLYHEETASCHWIGRNELIDKLSKMHSAGAMGNVSFREDGSRRGYVINIFGLNLQGPYQIGVWNSSNEEGERLKIAQEFSLSLSTTTDPQTHHPYKVLVVEEAPFAMLKPDHSGQLGNDKYSGFAIDLLAAMAELQQFTYELQMVRVEGTKGDYRRRGGGGGGGGGGVWERVTQQLIDRNASIALAAPMTAALEEVIDFSVPFHVSGVSLIALKHRPSDPPHEGSTTPHPPPPPPPPHWLLFLCQPLSSVVWILLFTALSVVTANVYVVERFSPSPSLNERGRMERRKTPSAAAAAKDESSAGAAGPGPWGPAAEDERRMMLRDTVWLTLSTILLLQSPSSCPRTVAGRIAVAGLHCFSLLLIASYTANLAALLTASRRTGPPSPSSQPPTQSPSPPLGTPRTVRELLERREVRFLTVRDSAVGAFLERSSEPHVHRVWQRILDDDGLVDRSELLGLGDPGADRCFVWDSAPVRYAVAQNCQLVELGVVPDARRYGLGLPQGAPYRDQLNMAILTLLEKGKIQTLQNKWLSGGDCDGGGEAAAEAAAAGGDGSPGGFHRGLQVDEVGGVFLIFAAFLVVSLSVSVFECCRHRHRIKGSCAPPVQPRSRSSGNCSSSSSSNRASSPPPPRHAPAPSSLLHAEEPISANSAKSFDVSAYHHHHHQQQRHLHLQQLIPPLSEQTNRHTNIF